MNLPAVYVAARTLAADLLDPTSSGRTLASAVGDRLRDTDPRAVVVVIGLFLLGAVLSFVRKLVFLGLALLAIGVVVLVYRAGGFDSVRDQLGG